LKRLITPETLAAHREVLAFTPEQEAELKRIFESAKAEAAPLEAAVQQQENSVNDTLRTTDLDPTAAEAKFAALLEAEGKLKQLQFKTLLALRGVLTPEQIEKAVSLEGQTRTVNAPLMATIEEKAGRLKAAFDGLEIKPAPELQAEGDRIRSLIQSGDLAAADAALDALGTKVGIDEPVDEATIDFSQQAPGDTDLNVLQGRFRAVESAAQKVTFLPKLRQLLQARDALEAAKAAEDAEEVGRVLTWAENLLGITTAR
jgi:hypothetical protein